MMSPRRATLLVAPLVAASIALAACGGLPFMGSEVDGTWYPGEGLPWSAVLDVDADGTALVSFHDDYEVVPAERFFPAMAGGEFPGIALVTRDGEVTVLTAPEAVDDDYRLQAAGSLRNGVAAWSFSGYPGPPGHADHVWVSHPGAEPLALSTQENTDGLVISSLDGFPVLLGNHHVFVLGSWEDPETDEVGRSPLIIPLDGSTPSAMRMGAAVNWIHRDLCAEVDGGFAVTFSTLDPTGDGGPQDWLQQWTIEETASGMGEPIRIASPARGSALKVPTNACGANAAAHVEVDGHGTFVAYREADTFHLEPHLPGMCCGDVFLSDRYLASLVFYIGQDWEEKKHLPTVSLTDLRTDETTHLGQAGRCGRLILRLGHIAYGDGERQDGSCRVAVRELSTGSA